MRGNQWHARQSAVLSGHQRPSAAISGTHLRGLGSAAISGHQRPSAAISGTHLRGLGQNFKQGEEEEVEGECDLVCGEGDGA